MQNVMQKAQELAEAIVSSDVYTRMKEWEEKVQTDPEASRTMENMIEKRKHVEDVLSSKDMDPNDLARASEEMEQAEKEMNDNVQIQTLKIARKDFSAMMDNVNRILRLIITGEVQEDDVSSGGCSGNCSQCSGCS